MLIVGMTVEMTLDIANILVMDVEMTVNVDKPWYGCRDDIGLCKSLVWLSRGQWTLAISLEWLSM